MAADSHEHSDDVCHPPDLGYNNVTVAFTNPSPTVMQGIRVLDADPDLGVALPPDRFEQARQSLVARTEQIPRGTWAPKPGGSLDTTGSLGLLVVEGALVRRLTLGHRSCAELLGTGDLLRPTQDGSAESSAPFIPSFRVLEPMTVAILDARFTLRATRFPELASEVVGRAMERSRALARMLAVAQLPRVDTRLMIAMWQLSERWGTVHTTGRVLPGFLSHELLGWIVGARRPSVTTALGQLSQRGLVLRQPDGTWLLPQRPDLDTLSIGYDT